MQATAAAGGGCLTLRPHAEKWNQHVWKQLPEMERFVKRELNTKWDECRWWFAEIPGLWVRQEAGAPSGLSRAIPEPLGDWAGTGQAAFTQMSWIWDVCKSAGSHLWAKWMDVRMSYLSKDFVTAPSLLKKKISILKGYLLLESEGLFSPCSVGVLCACREGGFGKMAFAPSCSDAAPVPCAQTLHLCWPIPGGLQEMSAVLPSRGSTTFWDLQLTRPALALSTLENGLWGGEFVSLFGYSCVSAAVLSLMPAGLLGMGSGLG